MQSRDGTNFEPSTFDSDVERINLATKEPHHWQEELRRSNDQWWLLKLWTKKMRQLPSVGDMRRAVITSAATTFVMGGEHSSRSFAAINWPPLLTPSLVQRLTANAMIAGRWSQSVAMGRSQAVWVWQSRARSCDPPCYNCLPSDAEWSICSCQPLCPTMHAGWCHVSLTKDEALRWGSRLSSSLAATTTMTAGRQAVTSLISHVTDGDWTRGEGGQLCRVSGHVAWTDLFKITMGCMIIWCRCGTIH